MRRLGLALVFVVLGLLNAAFPGAHAGTTVAASFQLDPAPSWQTPDYQNETGAWVKHSSPVVANLGDGPVILVGNQGGKLYALRYRNGALTKVWSYDVSAFIDSSPAVADLNGDGCPEVIVGATGQRPNSGVHVVDCHGRNHRFWAAPTASQPNHVGVFSTPAIGDVDGDHHPDVAYGSFNTKIYVKDANGHDLPGWPHPNYDTIWSSPALADINGDGRKEVIVGTDLGGGNAVHGCSKPTRGTLTILDAANHFTPNFPKCLDTPIWSSPAVQDVNGDGHLDVIVGTNNYVENGGNVGNASVVRAWDTRTGVQLWQTQLGSGTRVFSSPALGDVGGDGSLDVAIGTLGQGGGNTYLLDAHSGRIKWARNVGTCGACEFMGSPIMADVTGDGKADVIANSQDGALNAWDAAGNAVIAHVKMPNDYMFFNSPAVADLDGDGRNEIVLAGGLSGVSPRAGMVWVVDSAGRGFGPWSFFKRSIDRISAFGSGSFVASSVPTSGGAAHPTGATAYTSSGTHHAAAAARVGTPTATPADTASPAPGADGDSPDALATGTDNNSPSSSHGKLAALAAVMVVLACGGATLLARRRALRP